MEPLSQPGPSAYELTLLQTLSIEFPNIDWAMAEIARLSAVMTLPKGTIHVISDIHGEDKKLRHVINNASGTLRPLVEKVFSNRMDPAQLQEFLTLTFYPAEVTERLEKANLDHKTLREYAIRTMRRQFELIRVLATRYSLRRAGQIFPKEYQDLLAEMLHEPPRAATKNSSRPSSMNSSAAGASSISSTSPADSSATLPSTS